jgi:hypothetical protein
VYYKCRFQEFCLGYFLGISTWAQEPPIICRKFLNRPIFRNFLANFRKFFILVLISKWSTFWIIWEIKKYFFTNKYKINLKKMFEKFSKFFHPTGLRKKKHITKLYIPSVLVGWISNWPQYKIYLKQTLFLNLQQSPSGDRRYGEPPEGRLFMTKHFFKNKYIPSKNSN